MESALRPREIQTRIRSGESVEAVALAAGVPVERIEPYAGPVLAEREHVAAQAQRSSARRRGEASGHRELRELVAERLRTRSIDPETVVWDSHRMEDGRWAVSARYPSGESDREAVFHFDTRGRFSVAGNDEARWVLGEQSPLHGPQPGRQTAARRPGSEDPDSEPTLELSDELALVRAIQDAPVDGSPESPAAAGAGPGPAAPTEPTEPTEPVEVARIAVTRTEVSADVSADVSTEPATSRAVEPEATGTAPDGDATARAAGEELTDQQPAEVGALDEASELDLLYDMLGGVGYAEDSGRVYPGLAGIPEPETDHGWEPSVMINYPVEPEPEPDGVGPATGDPGEGTRERLIDDITGAGLDRHKVRTHTEPTMIGSDPVEIHPSDDTSQEEGEGFGRVDAEPSHPDGAGGDGEIDQEEGGDGPPLLPAPGGSPDGYDAAREDAVPESDEAPTVVPAEIRGPGRADHDQPSGDDGSNDHQPDDHQPDDQQPADGALVDAPGPARPKPARRKKRAEVPSWDEIMFGGPKRD